MPMLFLMGPKSAKYLLAIPAVAAIAAPIVYFQFFDKERTSKAKAVSSSGTTQLAGYEIAETLDVRAVGTETAASNAGAGMPSASIQHRSDLRLQDASTVFDFQITPEWIVKRWPAVSTGLAQLQLEGYRVPLVTGTKQHDLAGALTYYFNAEQKLQQITFVGATGDPRPLIGLLSGRFHLTRRLVNDPGLVIYESVQPNNQPASGLRIRLGPLSQPNASIRRYDVELSLVRIAE
jgi:hypothetical protein